MRRTIRSKGDESAMAMIFSPDKRLNTENFRLRKELEKMQSEGYLGSLIALHAEEVARLGRKMARAEKENATLREQRIADKQKIRQLEIKLRMSELGVEDLIVRLEEKEDEKSDLRAQLAQSRLVLQAFTAGQEETIQARLADREGVILKLKAQINRDYTNSSIPSSQCMGHGTIHNGRERTGRKPGGQPGHPGHSRTRQSPSSRTTLQAPCACTSCAGTSLLPTGLSKTRQLVDLSVTVHATDFVSEEYRCAGCGSSFYAAFPTSLPNEVNYGPEAKSFAAFLNSYCNVSLDKTSETLREMSAGAITLSKGTLSNLSREFSDRASAHLGDIRFDLRQAPVIHTDATSARVKGKNANIFVYANHNAKLYSAQAHKGIAALTGSPIDDYTGTLVHDHDLSFYHFGTGHQECNVHVLRYLLDAAENEPHLAWHGRMREHLLAMNRDRKALIMAGAQSFDPQTLVGYRMTYDAILDEADSEYSLHPPTKYYNNGFNLARRLRRFKANHLLFLEDFLLPFDNNLAERSLRLAKGKMKTAGTFRSMAEGMQRYCDFLSIAETAKCKGGNVYQTVRNVFLGEEDIWTIPE